MSAFIVSRKHIWYLAEAALSPALSSCQGSAFHWFHGEKHRELRCGDYEKASEIGQMLWNENILSVEYRYPNEKRETLPGPIDCDFVYGDHEGAVFAHCPRIEPVQVLKACDCYEYQSCEHPEWKTSEAKGFIEALRLHAINALPGYDAAKWSID